jgi:ATP phosphoribosyltransferase regulatory subunit
MAQLTDAWRDDPSKPDEGDDRRQGILVERLSRAGYRPIDTPILSPSSVFLDFSGEAIRTQLFLTNDGAGQELCLRPEFTIPVCRAYLAAGARRQAAYCYAGPVFRSEGHGTGQFIQSGLESFGRPDTAAADAEILALSLEAAAEAGFADPEVRMGDAGLLARLFDVLQLPPAWRRRLKRGFGKGQSLRAILEETPPRGNDHSGVIAALTGTDEQGARALVEDLLSIAGIATVGGRTASEIAERFLAQVASHSAPAFGNERRQVLERFLAITGHPDDAAMALRDLARDARLDLAEILDLFDDRANFLAAYGLDPAMLVFDAAFVRDLDYYTGFTFEARHRGAFSGERKNRADEVVIGGGRYDGLAQALGSPEPVAAVGAAIFVERIGRGEASRHA